MHKNEYTTEKHLSFVNWCAQYIAQIKWKCHDASPCAQGWLMVSDIALGLDFCCLRVWWKHYKALRKIRDHITLVRERELMQRYSLILTFHDSFAHFLTLQPPTSCTCLPSSPTLSPAPANNPTRAQHYSPCPQAPRKTFRWRFNYMNKTLTSSYLILNCSRSKISLHEPCFKTHSCDDTVEFYTHQVSTQSLLSKKYLIQI